LRDQACSTAGFEFSAAHISVVERGYAMNFARGAASTRVPASFTVDCILSADRNRSRGAAFLARLAKREGDFELACLFWKDALGNSL